MSTGAELTIADVGQRPQTWTATPDRLAAELREEFPEIVTTARTRGQSIGLRHGDVESTEDIKWADKDFFAVLQILCSAATRRRRLPVRIP